MKILQRYLLLVNSLSKAAHLIVVEKLLSIVECSQIFVLTHLRSLLLQAIVLGRIFLFRIPAYYVIVASINIAHILVWICLFLLD